MEAKRMTGFARQLARRTVPGFVDVLGSATNPGSVTVHPVRYASVTSLRSLPQTRRGDAPRKVPAGGVGKKVRAGPVAGLSHGVNDQLAYRRGDYYRAELTVSNAVNPVWLGITNLAVLSVGGGNYVVSNVTGRVLWPKTPETFTYDADGNLRSDSLWTNTWNGENRRMGIESMAGVPPVARMKEQWTHLPDGRWIERIVSTNDGSGYFPAYTNRYVWDGQVLLAVLDHTNGLVMSFMRGSDLSGTVNGAGGVGGLLAVVVGPAGPAGLADTTHFACYDGNGNVVALVNAATGEESARYEYGPFAEPIRVTGPLGKLNPIRFSTQYADDVIGDVKYLHRDYRPDLGRWLSRDQIGQLLGALESSRTDARLSQRLSLTRAKWCETIREHFQLQSLAGECKRCMETAIARLMSESTLEDSLHDRHLYVFVDNSILSG